MAWPQILVIVVFVITLTSSGILHGKMRDIDFFGRAANIALLATLLHFGGFWK